MDRANSGISPAHAGSPTRVTSMGGLYDAATLHALMPKTNEATALAVALPRNAVVSERIAALAQCAMSGGCAC